MAITREQERAAPRAWRGVAWAYALATALLFGTAPATLAIASNGLVFSLRRRLPARQIFFNVGSLSVTMWVAGRTFFSLAHVQPLALSEARRWSAAPRGRIRRRWRSASCSCSSSAA